ncbi:MAG TPA: C4-dicarboxylate ABC transporter substrate-binding protein [Alcanivorax sp.]|nr:C4-dicarboxylate ABC transporter substrate-binding protein [Alcanivorax sp.]
MRTKSSFLRGTLFAVLCGLAALSYADGAKKLRYATSWPPGSIGADAAKLYAEAVSEYSDGELSVKVYPMTLLNAAETSSGVRDGMADIGFVFAGYFPAEFPHVNFLNETSMQLHNIKDELTSGGRGAAAFQGAISEFIMLHCPECQDDYARQNQVYTSHGGTSRYGLLCTTPVRSLDDLEGKRLRIVGSNWARWADQMGAQSVSLTINEVMEGLSQGVVDCTVSAAPELINLRLMDVVTDITMDVPGGIFAGSSPTNVNRNVWRGLSESQRRAMLKAGALMTAQGPWQYIEMEQEALHRAQENGATLHSADESLIALTKQFADDDIDTITDYYAEKYGIENSEEMLTDFQDVLEKWVQYVQGVESLEDLNQLYWEKIFSQVETESYGM